VAAADFDVDVVPRVRVPAAVVVVMAAPDAVDMAVQEEERPAVPHAGARIAAVVEAAGVAAPGVSELEVDVVFGEEVPAAVVVPVAAAEAVEVRVHDHEGVAVPDRINFLVVDLIARIEPFIRVDLFPGINTWIRLDHGVAAVDAAGD